MAQFTEIPGQPISPSELVSSRAQDLATALEDCSLEFARMVECRAAEATDIVIFDAEVEVPQRPTYPVRPLERIAVLFDRRDAEMPEVLALREDFPRTPHLNLREFERPRSLCLYDERFRDIKRRWTPPRFVEQIRDWLALTAKGKLHQDDQPLEPLMSGHVGTIVLPSDLLEPGPDAHPTRLTVTATDLESGKCFLLADRSERRARKEGFRVVASIHRCEPQEHGVIRHRPGNVKVLADFVAPYGLDLLAELRARLGEWSEEASKDSTVLEHHLAVVVVMPKTRNRGTVVESKDVWAFLSTETIREAGQKLGVWQLEDGVMGHILGGDTLKVGQDLKLDLLNPALRLARSEAATLNGHTSPGALRIATVGAGALGSQVAMNLARSGFGTWSVIDDDRLMPHNLARHASSGYSIGYAKAEILSNEANSLFEVERPFTAVVADVVEPGDKEGQVSAALNDAELILDMSASLTVARHLAFKAESVARRVSLFLTPTGEDLVMLAEDRDRNFLLDSLEMQYYRALIEDGRLAGHFKPRDIRRRYGQSCRDITSNLPQELVALHAALGSRAVRDMHASPSARITVWRANRDGTVSRVDVGAAPSVRHRVGEWTVSIDALLIQHIATLRESKLPKETGGVLLGSFDLENKIVYFAHTIASPPDSEEWPTLYIRGCKGLRKQVEEVGRLTDGMLEYIGEWHSHPAGCPTTPSDDDLQVFAWLAGLMNADGLPATMMIIGDGGHASCFVGTMAKAENLLPISQDGRSARGW